jgi:magnesium-transporting ATPase (P-type)
MLTGDKLETAENIGEACKLLKNKGMERYRLSNEENVKKFCSFE